MSPSSPTAPNRAAGMLALLLRFSGGSGGVALFAVVRSVRMLNGGG